MECSRREAAGCSLAFFSKKAIIRTRWKLKSRRDLRVLPHSQARAGETAPTRNSPAVHDDILIIQWGSFLHKRSACAAGSEAGVMRWPAVGRRDCAASRNRRYSLFLDPASGKGRVRISVMRSSFLFTAGLFPVDWGWVLGFQQITKHSACVG